MDEVNCRFGYDFMSEDLADWEDLNIEDIFRISDSLETFSLSCFTEQFQLELINSIWKREIERVGISQTVDQQEFLKEFRNRTVEVKNEEFVKDISDEIEKLENYRIYKILSPYPKSF